MVFNRIHTLTNTIISSYMEHRSQRHNTSFLERSNPHTAYGSPLYQYQGVRKPTFSGIFNGKSIIEVMEENDRSLQGFPFARGFGVKATKLVKWQQGIPCFYSVIEQNQRWNELLEKKARLEGKQRLLKSPERGIRSIERSSRKNKDILTRT